MLILLGKLNFYLLKGEPGLPGARGLPVSNTFTIWRGFLDLKYQYESFLQLNVTKKSQKLFLRFQKIMSYYSSTLRNLFAFVSRFAYITEGLCLVCMLWKRKQHGWCGHKFWTHAIVFHLFMKMHRDGGPCFICINYFNVSTRWHVFKWDHWSLSAVWDFPYDVSYENKRKYEKGHVKGTVIVGMQMDLTFIFGSWK